MGSCYLYSPQERHFCLDLLAQDSSNRLSPSNLYEKHPVQQHILKNRGQSDVLAHTTIEVILDQIPTWG